MTFKGVLLLLRRINSVRCTEFCEAWNDSDGMTTPKGPAPATRRARSPSCGVRRVELPRQRGPRPAARRRRARRDRDRHGRRRRPRRAHGARPRPAAPVERLSDDPLHLRAGARPSARRDARRLLRGLRPRRRRRAAADRRPDPRDRGRQPRRSTRQHPWLADVVDRSACRSVPASCASTSSSSPRSTASASRISRWTSRSRLVLTLVRAHAVSAADPSAGSVRRREPHGGRAAGPALAAHVDADALPAVVARRHRRRRARRAGPTTPTSPTPSASTG